MKNYSVDIVEQAHESLRIIIIHKIEYGDERSAKRFADGFYKVAGTLSSLPHRGFTIANANKAIVYKDHLIIYQIAEPDNVRILDIIDPRQHTVASKYY